MIEGKDIFSCFSTNIMISNSQDLNVGDLRLDAGFYEVKNSIQVRDGIEFFPLEKIAKVVFPGIFKRVLVDNDKYGIKFLTTSDMMMLEPDTDKFLSVPLTSNLDIYRVSENVLLVSRSGSIGNVIYVDERIKNYAVTEDALRVTPYDISDIGLLYFYFTSEYGNDLITGKKSGAVIDHIYEEDLLNLKVPKLDINIRVRLYDAYKSVKEKREEAHRLIMKSRSLILEYNFLPSLYKVDMFANDPNEQIEIREISLSDITEDLRLDSHFYNPIATTAIKNIQENASKHLTLNELSNDIIIGKRFKRNYVESDHGTPFIGSKNILQIRPTELKYLSNSEICFMHDLMLSKNMILIACSGSLGGTFGKVGFVYNNFENYAASQHILRIVVNDDLIDPGYLYAFLSSNYGYECITRYRWGALIDEIDDENMSKILIPMSTENQQKEIGDLVRQAFDLRAEAIQLENESQELLSQALTQD
jgi:type I restriction enzyme, S subunit